MSHWSWCHPATFYAAFLFLSSFPSLLYFFHSIFSFKMYSSHRFFISKTACKSFLLSFTMCNTYSLVVWSFKLKFSIFRLTNIAKASNISFFYFRSVNFSNPYKASFQTIVYISFFFLFECVYCNSALNLCCTSPIIWDERSQIVKLNHS